jgi:hypothetical protein
LKEYAETFHNFLGAFRKEYSSKRFTSFVMHVSPTVTDMSERIFEPIKKLKTCFS